MGGGGRLVCWHLQARLGAPLRSFSRSLTTIYLLRCSPSILRVATRPARRAATAALLLRHFLPPPTRSFFECFPSLLRPFVFHPYDHSLAYPSHLYLTLLWPIRPSGKARAAAGDLESGRYLFALYTLRALLISMQRPAPPPTMPVLSDLSSSPSIASPYAPFPMSPSPFTFPALSPQMHSSDFNYFATTAPTPSAIDMNFVGLDPINTGLFMGSLGGFGFPPNSASLAPPLSEPSPFAFGSPRQPAPSPFAGPDPFAEWFQASTPAPDVPLPPVHLSLPPTLPVRTSLI